MRRKQLLQWNSLQRGRSPVMQIGQARWAGREDRGRTDTGKKVRLKLDFCVALWICVSVLSSSLILKLTEKQCGGQRDWKRWSKACLLGRKELSSLPLCWVVSFLSNSVAPGCSSEVRCLLSLHKALSSISSLKHNTGKIWSPSRGCLKTEVKNIET